MFSHSPKKFTLFLILFGIINIAIVAAVSTVSLNMIDQAIADLPDVPVLKIPSRVVVKPQEEMVDPVNQTGEIEPTI